MENQKQTSFMFEIDIFSEKEDLSPNFLSGGCEWFVKVYPKGKYMKDYLNPYLCIANPESLRLGLIRARFSFVLLNQSGKELYNIGETCKLFSARFSRWSISTLLKILQNEGVFAKNKLILKVEVKVLEVVDEGDVTGDEMLDFNGFQVLYSQVDSVKSLFMKNPCIAVNFRLTNQLVRTTYMNLLLGLIDTLNKPPHSLSDTELGNARSELIELTTAGFEVDWLKTMFIEVALGRKKKNANEVALERKKENANGSRAEEHRPNIESNNEKVKSATRDWLEGVVRSWNKWKGRLEGKETVEDTENLLYPLLL